MSSIDLDGKRKDDFARVAATRMRELRLAAGDPTFREMYSKRADYWATVAAGESDAPGGRLAARSRASVIEHAQELLADATAGYTEDEKRSLDRAIQQGAEGERELPRLIQSMVERVQDLDEIRQSPPPVGWQDQPVRALILYNIDARPEADVLRARAAFGSARICTHEVRITSCAAVRAHIRAAVSARGTEGRSVTWIYIISHGSYEFTETGDRVFSLETEDHAHVSGADLTKWLMNRPLTEPTTVVLALDACNSEGAWTLPLDAPTAETRLDKRRTLVFPSTPSHLFGYPNILSLALFGANPLLDTVPFPGFWERLRAYGLEVHDICNDYPPYYGDAAARASSAIAGAEIDAVVDRATMGAMVVRHPKRAVLVFPPLGSPEWTHWTSASLFPV